MANPPTFFFSHARQDQETPGNYLLTFFRDLEIRLAQWAGISLKEMKLGTFDKRIKHGENWDEDLSRGLGNDSCFVAILTPLYFNRPNCGKELAVFLLRSRPGLGIDANGSLTGVRNLLPIRWLPQEAYRANGVPDALIPKIIHLVEDAPADEELDDPERADAIKRYRKKGMENCVQKEPYYNELLALFVSRIIEMTDMPKDESVSFATARDAFKYDWASYFSAAGAVVESTTTSASAAAYPAIELHALSSLVVFYVTNRPFTSDKSVGYFADRLVAESLSCAPTEADPALGALLADVRAAGVAEGLTVFHAAPDPAVPTYEGRLLSQLAALSASCVLTALVVDPSVWPGGASKTPGAETVEHIIRSTEWTGPVLLPAFSEDANVNDADWLVKTLGVPARLVTLPYASEARVAALRRSFVDARGRVLRASSTAGVAAAESLPVLKGVGSEEA